jgi:hypothetical protein
VTVIVNEMCDGVLGSEMLECYGCVIGCEVVSCLGFTQHATDAAEAASNTLLGPESG